MTSFYSTLRTSEQNSIISSLPSKLAAHIHAHLRRSTLSGSVGIPLPDDLFKGLNEAEEERSLLTDNVAKIEEWNGRRYALPPHLAETERRVAERLVTLALNTRFDYSRNIIQEGLGGKDPSAEQLEAVRTALSNPITVITGGPGTGKTTIVKVLADSIQVGAGKRLGLTCPTGKGAHRLRQSTGREAQTIHQFFRINPGDPLAPLSASEVKQLGLIVVDEASMIDLDTLEQMLFRLPEQGIGIVFVGDIHQLPSVGPGNILHDIIESGLAKVVRLTRNYRQGSVSTIAEVANQVLKGEVGIVSTMFENDFAYLECPREERAFSQLVDYASTRIPRRFGVSVRDMMLLSPMKAGFLGCDHLNESLRQTLNTEFRPDFKFCKGDRVINLRNNYAAQVWNGSVGTVENEPDAEGSFDVLFDDEERRVTYNLKLRHEISLAYCLTVHKMQGSETGVIALPLVKGHSHLMTRSLIYTAMTRARTLCFLIGDKKILQQASKRTERRLTFLKERIKLALESAD